MAGRPDRFGERLRRYREAAGYSQEALAERAGLSANAISALERGERRRPYPDTLRRLAEALGLSQAEREELAETASRSRSNNAPERDPALATSHRTKAELPGEPTPLIGRESEAGVVRHLLAHAEGRLLTLTGPGGVGKTRLALHVARAVSFHYTDGVAWVELAPLADSDLVLSTIARTLGLEDALADDPGEALRAFLDDKHALLVLDNLEHLLDAAPDIAALLRACPGIAMLVTSRAPLNVRGEQEYVVPPLELPPAGQTGSTDILAAVPAVEFFVWRARQKDAGFSLSEENSAAVSAICRRLDGVPLALELAAARVQLLGVSELLARLDRALPILTGGSRDLPIRQRTMEAAIRWSYDLLRPAEQALFRRLAVFAGGWTLEAAEAVVHIADSVEVDVFNGMAALIDQSLVCQVDGPDGTRRFTALETLREFGLLRLIEAGEAEAVQFAHLEWCIALAEAAGKGLLGPEQRTWLERLEMEHDNIRSALGSSLAGADEARLRLAGALWRFWWWHGHFTEGRGWLAQILARDAHHSSPWRGTALVAAGILAREQGDFPHATSALEESLAIRQKLGDRRGVAQSLNILGLVASSQGHLTRASRLHEEALELYREIGDTQGIAAVLNNLGLVARDGGEPERAIPLYEESVALYRQLGERRGVALTLHNLGRVARDLGDLDRAADLLEQCLAVERELGDRLNMAMTLHNLGRVARDGGDVHRAAELYAESLAIRMEFGDKLGCIKVVEDVAELAASAGDDYCAMHLYGAATAVREALGAPVPPADRDRIQRVLTLARQHLPADAVDDALRRGRDMTADQAVQSALSILGRAPGAEPAHDRP